MNEPRNVSHDETVVEMLKADPDFANEYLAAPSEEVELPGGQTALLAALRHIAEAQGMTAVTARARNTREILYRALSPKVVTMNLDNFVVRPQRKSVEKFAKREAWSKLDVDSFTELE